MMRSEVLVFRAMCVPDSRFDIEDKDMRVSFVIYRSQVCLLRCFIVTIDPIHAVKY